MKISNLKCCILANDQNKFLVTGIVSLTFIFSEIAFYAWIYSCLNDMIQLPLSRNNSIRFKLHEYSRVISWHLHGLQSAWLQFISPFWVPGEKKLSAWKVFLVLGDELRFFLIFLSIGTLNASFNKLGCDKADNKI